DSIPIATRQHIKPAWHHDQRTGSPLLLHAQIHGPIDKVTETLAHADWRHYATYLQSRPDEADLSAIRLLLSLCRQYKFRLHIVHLSTSQALRELSAARSELLPVSVETCPHYLHLPSETIAD